MPHYRDGTPAKVGDRVRGTGYNAQAGGYNPAQGIEGIVTNVRPGDDQKGACTLTVAFLRVAPLGHYSGLAHVSPSGPALVIETEYGDTVGFTKVDPPATAPIDAGG